MRRVLTHAALGEGAMHLAALDRDLASVVKRLGVPPMWGRRPGFPALVQIILEQQVSIVAARTLYRRVAAALGGMTEQNVRRRGEAGLRKLGLTRQKARFCHGLAVRLLDGSLDLSVVARLPAGHVRAVPATELAVKFIGRPAPNTALLGAFAAEVGVVSLDSVLEAIRRAFPGKVGEANVEAAKAAHALVATRGAA